MRARRHSARRLADELPDEQAVYPTHGFGSFCSATRSGGLPSAIGQGKLSNPALTGDEQPYIAALLAGLDAHPAYYAHMGPANAAGHVAGTINFGLDVQFVTYLGWLILWGTPQTLIGETAEDVAEAQRELVRIGIDRPAAMATGKLTDWAGETELASFAQATFAGPR